MPKMPESWIKKFFFCENNLTIKTNQLVLCGVGRMKRIKVNRKYAFIQFLLLKFYQDEIEIR
jgi:hypothetical protein